MTESGFVEVNGFKVWFEKFGSGPNIVLLMPGPIGTARTDFEELIDSEDELDFDKFTVVAVDPPGQGKSCPPQRKYGKETYNIDCECYHAVMKHLAIVKYSIIGWSEGAKVALLMAIRCPTEVEALVLIGITSFMSNKNIIELKKMKSVANWSKKRIDNYLRAYKSAEDIQKHWNRYLIFAEFYNQYFPEDIFKDKYQSVKCATLIVHGDKVIELGVDEQFIISLVIKDPIIELDQPLAISQRLPFAKVHRFPNGEHDCHQKYAMKFVKYVQDHIINRDEVIKQVMADKIDDNTDVVWKEYSQLKEK